MGIEKLLIHFQPGARGDFFASVLLDSFKEKEHSALHTPESFKLHFINTEHWQPYSLNDIKNFKGLKIRIDAGLDAHSLVEIEVNHIIKNKLTVAPSLYYESVYFAVVNFLNTERPHIEENKHLYDYWVSYKDLRDPVFLQEFYYKVNGYNISDELLDKAKKNISKQIDILKDRKIVNLIKLLNFEIENNCLNRIKKFNLSDALDNIESYLTVDSYSTELEIY